jgi:hypothetical protein
MAITDPFASIRNELRGALADYSAEAARVRSLRLRLYSESPEERRVAIQIRQAALDAAKIRFERAQEQYAKDVLGDLVSSPLM